MSHLRWLVHNCVAHPLLGVAQTLHDLTAPEEIPTTDEVCRVQAGWAPCPSCGRPLAVFDPPDDPDGTSVILCGCGFSQMTGPTLNLGLVRTAGAPLAYPQEVADEIARQMERRA